MDKLSGQLNIRAKLTIAFVLVSILPLLVLGLYEIDSNVDALEGSALKDVSHYVLTVKERIEGFLASAESDIQFLGEHFLFRGLVSALEKGDLQNIERWRPMVEEHLLAFSESRGIYYQIRYINRWGDEVIRIDSDGRRAHIVPQHRLQSRSEAYYFARAGNLRPGQTFFFPVELKGVRGGELIPVISFVLPVFDSGDRLQGMLIANIFARDLFHILEETQVSPGGETVLVSNEGFYLYHQGKGKKWRQFLRPLASLEDNNLRHDYPPEIVSEVLSGRSGVIAQDTDKVISYAPLLRSQDRGSFYVVFHTIPKDVIFGPVRSFKLFFLFFIALTFTGAVAVAFLTARHFTRPIAELSRGAGVIAGGGFDHRLNIRTNDEIEKLADDFNLMAESIEEREKVIRQQAENLERMVDERTRELRAAQAQLIQSEKLAAVGKLAAGIAHEINNPAGVILMKLKFLLSIAEEQKLSARAMKTLKTVVGQTERIARITHGLLAFARETGGSPVPTDVNRVIEESLILSEQLLSMRKIKLVKRLEINLPWVEADPNELEQVVLNLVNNAIDAMPEGGVLTIETKNSLVDGAETLSEVSGVDQLVIIQVEDTGTGIPEENVHRIFDPFFTTKEVSKGTGLGLSISYGIVKNLGGTIEVASSPGAGTIFTVKVPTDGR